MKNMALIGFAAAAPLLAACGSAAVPADRLASSEAAIRSAQTVGANQHPQGALHVRLAQEQMEVAKKLIGDGDNERAAEILARAEADAEVAIALAKETQIRAEAQKAKSDVESLRAKSQTHSTSTSTARP